MAHAATLRSRVPLYSGDVLDYPQSTWWYTPTVSYADLTGLEGLAPATVASSSITSTMDEENVATEVTLHNTSQVVALALRASLQGRGGEEIVPVRWSVSVLRAVA